MTNYTEPKVSVIMPTFNRAQPFLPLAIDSVLKQSYANFEFIIVDDASTDNTSQVIKKFADARIIYNHSQENHGEYWATNHAVTLARGQYLTWIHSDDIMAPLSLELRVKELVQNPDIDFVHGNIIKIDKNGKELESIMASDLSKDQLLREYLRTPINGESQELVHHLTVMMRTEFFSKTGGFDESLPFAGDIDWLLKAIIKGRFKKIDQVLYFYRTHELTRRVVDRKNGIDVDAVNKMIRERYASLLQVS